jgi:hypothetical protein
MVEELQRIMGGRIQVRCHRTLMKCGLHMLLRVVDQYPKTVIIGTTAVASLLLAAVVQSLLKLF